MISTKALTGASGLLAGQSTPQRARQPGAEFDRSLFQRVKDEVDLRRVLPDDPDIERYDRYDLRRCISPEHNDRKKSMLVYADGCHCLGCGFKADAVDVYVQHHPELTKTQAAEALLSGDYVVEVTEPDIVSEKRTRPNRQLDQDLAVKHHLVLAQTPQALEGIAEFGFSHAAVQQFRIGWAEVLVPLDAEERQRVDEAEIVWLDTKRGRRPYQKQWRYSVPVFHKGRLVQLLYRKADERLPGPKVIREWGTGTFLFNADALVNADTAVITGGWGDTVALWQWGIVGVNSTAGDGHFSHEWLPLVGKVRKLYIIGDADSSGQAMVARLRERLPWAVPVILDWEPGSKMDVRDGLKAGWSRETVLRMLKEAEAKARWEAMLRR